MIWHWGYFIKSLMNIRTTKTVETVIGYCFNRLFLYAGAWSNVIIDDNKYQEGLPAFRKFSVPLLCGNRKNRKHGIGSQIPFRISVSGFLFYKFAIVK